MLYSFYSIEIHILTAFLFPITNKVLSTGIISEIKFFEDKAISSMVWPLLFVQHNN